MDIRREIALCLAKEEANLAIIDVNMNSAQTVQIIEKTGGKALSVYCDIHNKRLTEKAFVAVNEISGRAKILVNKPASWQALR